MSLSWRVRASIGALVVTSVVLSSAAAANAAWVNDTFHVRDGRFADPSHERGYTDGVIIWGNRTATVSGTVYDSKWNGEFSTIALFEAYAGANKIDIQRRTASGGGSRGFSFAIGDPDLVGGIDRVRITVCWAYGTEPYIWCSDPMLHFMRNGVNDGLDD